MTALILTVATCLLIGYVVTAITTWADAELDRHVEAALALPPPDATDAEFEQWARDALCIGNSAAFEAAVRADIDALPTTKETSAW